MGGLAAAWLTFVSIQTVKYEKANGPALPPPTLYIGSAVVYGLLGLVAIPQPKFAAIVGWGWIVGALVTNSFGTGTTQNITGKPARPAGPNTGNGAGQAGDQPGPPRRPTARSGRSTDPSAGRPPILAPAN